MPRKCSICIHTKRTDIEEALLKGDSYRLLSTDYDCSEQAIKRHVKNGHVSKRLSQAQESKDIIRDDDLEAQVKYWKDEIKGMYDELRNGEDKDLRVALNAPDKAFRYIELQERLIGKLQSNPTVNIFVNPDFILVKQILVEELKDFPEQQIKIARRLADAERTRTGS